MSSPKIVVSGTGCALADYLYPQVSFDSPAFRKFLSVKPGDGGLSPGKLVFTEELEKFAGTSYRKILDEITGGRPPASFNIGGPGLVSMIHVAQMLGSEGFEVCFHGLTGNDDTASRIFSLLDNTPLDIAGYKRGSERATPFTDVFSDPNYDNGHGERTFVNNIGAAWDLLPGNLPESFFESDIVCFGGTAIVPQIHDHLDDLLVRAKSKGCITVVNTVYDFRNEKARPGERWPLVSEENFRSIDVLVMDREEALKISGTGTVSDAASYFCETGVSSFFLTNGAEPVTVFSDGRLFSGCAISNYPVSRMVASSSNPRGDTTGCGDNFAGGLIASLAEQLNSGRRKKLNLTEALSWAVASGGFACFYIGGTYFEGSIGEKRGKVNEFRRDYQKQITAE